MEPPPARRLVSTAAGHRALPEERRSKRGRAIASTARRAGPSTCTRPIRSLLLPSRNSRSARPRASLPSFDTISYLDMWVRVNAVASGWRRDVRYPVTPGDFVATIGFASPEYLIIDLVCTHLGLVSVPLQHNAPASRLKPIIDEVTPKVVAVSAEYLDLAIDATRDGESLRRLVVFDYQPEVDDQREKFDAARRRLRHASAPVILETFDEVVARGRMLAPEPEYTGETDARLAMILYTSGETVNLAITKKTPGGGTLAETAIAQSAIARVEAEVAAARLLLLSCAETLETARDGEVTLEDRAALRGAMSHGARVSRDAMVALYELCSWSSLYQSNPLERLFRDGMVALQHANHSAAFFEAAVRVRFGLDHGVGLF